MLNDEVMVILTAGSLSEGDRTRVSRALQQRGFEIHAERGIERLNEEWLPDPFKRGGRVLVAFNALIREGEVRPAAIFPQFEVEKAAHLLANAIPDGADKFRVARDAQTAGKIIAQVLDECEIAELRDTIAERKAGFDTDLPVLKDLSRYRYRAKVELVEWQGKRAVKKTFRPFALDAKERELAFHDAIAPLSPVPARVLDRAGQAIIFEFVEDDFKARGLFGLRLLSLLDIAHTRALAEFVQLVLAEGWDPIDLTPGGNLLIDRRSGALRAIDFEFARFRGRALTPNDACFLTGVPEGATFAHPLNNDMTATPYDRLWRRFTGLSMCSFLEDPAWLQRVKRILIHPFWLCAFVIRELRRRRLAARDRDHALRAMMWERSASG